MAAFNKTYDESTPQGSDLASTLDTVIQTDKIAIDERYELEHISLVDGVNDTDSAGAQGRHNPGKVSVALIGNTAAIAALTGMKSGAFAYDTDLGTLKIFNGTDWDTYAVGGTSAAAKQAFRAYMSSAQSIPSATLTKCVFDGESYDYGSAFDKDTNYRFTSTVNGLYFITAQVQIASGSGNHSTIRIYKNGVQYSLGTKGSPSISVDEGSIVTDMIPLDVDDYVEIYLLHADSSAADVNVGEDQTNFSGYLVASL